MLEKCVENGYKIENRMAQGDEIKIWILLKHPRKAYASKKCKRKNKENRSINDV